jgi:Zn-dependent protease
MTSPPVPEKSSSAPPKPAAGTGSRTGSKALLGALGAALVFLLTKFKVLAVLAGVLKLKTLATMLLSIAVYATQWGWAFAAGFVLLILVHELGHAIVLHREGIPAGAPVFIPFVGAFIAMRGRPRDAYVEAKVAFGGPLLGSIAAWATLAAGLALDLPLLVALGHSAALLNLFNLIPVHPLDGGRIVGVFSRSIWIAGYAVGIVATIVLRSAVLAIVMAVGLVSLWRLSKNPVPGYHDVPAGRRLAMGVGYAVLVVGLALTLQIGAPDLGLPR